LDVCGWRRSHSAGAGARDLRGISQIDPSQVRDLDGALTIFDAERASIEAAASVKYDIPDIEPERYEGQPMIILRTDDLT
jgi:hypothetical protein